MYSVLKSPESKVVSTDSHASILKIIGSIESAKTGIDFFNCTCLISVIFEKLNSKETSELYRESNIYILVVNAVFRNEAFVSVVRELIESERSVNDLVNEDDAFEKLVLINSAVSLAFFGVSISYSSLNKLNVEYLRKNLKDLIKNIRKTNDPIFDFSNTCYFFERIIRDNKFHINSNYDTKFPVFLDAKFLFSILKTGRSIAGITFLSLSIRPVIENRFKKIVAYINNDSLKFSKGLDLLYEAATSLEDKFEEYSKNIDKDLGKYFGNFIKKNERNLIYCLKEVCSGFFYQPDKKFAEIIFNKVESSSASKRRLIEYTKSNFRAFNSDVADVDGEWTNKIFLISIKTFASLEVIDSAVDKKWSLTVCLYELYQWILDVHEVLNKYYIEDDWDKIRDFVAMEGIETEWKSSFFLPLEQECEGAEKEKESHLKERVFASLLKAVLAMLNSNGGTIIVGLVENPQNIKRQDVLPYILSKNGQSFFDVSHELKILGKTLDSVRLQIVDNLKQLTDSTQDKFNDLIDIEPIMLRSEEKTVTVIKVTIRKSLKPFFKVKRENNTVWIALTKRAHGQSIDVDIREHF